MDNGCVTGLVFLDLSKALDTVDHKLLLKKLKSLGFDNNSMDWFKSSLSTLELVVSIGNSLVPNLSQLEYAKFRFYKNDINKLADVLQLPDKFVTHNGLIV